MHLKLCACKSIIFVIDYNTQSLTGSVWRLIHIVAMSKNNKMNKIFGDINSPIPFVLKKNS